MILLKNSRNNKNFLHYVQLKFYLMSLQKGRFRFPRICEIASLLRNWLENGPATLCRILRRVSRQLCNVTHFTCLDTYVPGYIRGGYIITSSCSYKANARSCTQTSEKIFARRAKFLQSSRKDFLFYHLSKQHICSIYSRTRHFELRQLRHFERIYFSS